MYLEKNGEEREKEQVRDYEREKVQREQSVDRDGEQFTRVKGHVETAETKKIKQISTNAYLLFSLLMMFSPS